MGNHHDFIWVNYHHNNISCVKNKNVKHNIEPRDGFSVWLIKKNLSKNKNKKFFGLPSSKKKYIYVKKN